MRGESNGVGFQEKAVHLKEALSRIDRDRDGMLSFQEFSSGIRSLGINLEDREVLKIWNEAGASGTAGGGSHGNSLDTAGVRTQLGEQDCEDGRRTVRKMFPERQEYGGSDHIDGSLMAKPGTDTADIDGRHSHRKIAFGPATSIVAMENGISSNINDPGNRRPNLSPPDQMKGAVSYAPFKKTKSPQAKPKSSSPTAAELMTSPTHAAEYAVVKKALMEREGRGEQWLSDMGRERELEKESGKGEGRTVRAGIVNEKILRELREKEERVRQAMTLVAQDAQARSLAFDELRTGLSAAGLLLGEGDCKAVWAAAGGDVSWAGQASGTVNMDAFLHKMAMEDRQQQSMLNGGYAVHMRSNLNKGWAVRDDADAVSLEGGHKGKARSFDHATLVDEALAEHKQVRTSERLSKWEEHVKNELQEHRAEIRRAFKVYEPGTIAERENAGQGGREGVNLNYADLRNNLHKAGIHVSERDYEALWRRADKQCMGAVSYADLATAFSVSDVKNLGESPIRKKFALPHLQDPEPLVPLRERVVKTTARDHIGLHMLQSNPKFLQELRSAVGKGDVTEERFKQCLSASNVLVSDSDAHELFRRADCTGAGKVTMQSVDTLFRPTESITQPNHPVSLLGFGTGYAFSKVGTPLQQVHGTWGTQEPSIRKIYEKLAGSVMGNPHRLRRAFRKYDVDRNGQVSRSEFMQALITNNTPITRDEAQLLAQVADLRGAGAVSYEGFIEELQRTGGEKAHGDKASVTRGAGETGKGDMSIVNRSMNVDRRGSTSSIRSVRSSASFQSVSSQRSTSSFMGADYERSDWMMDSRLKEAGTRRQMRGTQSGISSVASQPSTASRGAKILHLASPPPPCIT